MHFVYCWEMGADLGHITQLANLGMALRSRGHRVSAIVSDTTHALRYLHPLGIPWFQAPRLIRPSRMTVPLNHADILLAHGYDSAANLAGLVQAWRSLLQRLQPDRLLTEAAPTAILAARTLGLRAINLDKGFFTPPLSTPLPPLRDSPPVETSQLRERETRVIANVDKALIELGLSPIRSFSLLFDSDTWWLTWPELNHFGYHTPERHLGPIYGSVAGVSPTWPQGRGTRIFAYLKPTCPESLPALEWCITQGYRVSAYLPRWPRGFVRRLERTGRISASSEPLDLDAMLETCDLTLCHAGIGTVTRSLRAGKPLLLLPTHIEQFRTACAAVGQQLALMPVKAAPAGALAFDTTQLEHCSRTAAVFARQKPTSQEVMKRLIGILESNREPAPAEENH